MGYSIKCVYDPFSKETTFTRRGLFQFALPKRFWIEMESFAREEAERMSHVFSDGKSAYNVVVSFDDCFGKERNERFDWF